jgi:hypothetical protein
MSLSNYAGLKASVANWLNRTDLSTEIVDFIELAENRISHELRIPAMEKTILLNVSSEGYAVLPSDFLEAKDIFWNYEPLDRITPAQLYRMVDRSGVAPEFYARETYRLKFYPTPTVTASDEMRMIYYFDPGRLTDAAPTNVLLSTAPELFLFGALVQAAVFLGTDLAQKDAWEAEYQTALARLTKHAREAEFAGGTPMVQSGY